MQLHICSQLATNQIYGLGLTVASYCRYMHSYSQIYRYIHILIKTLICIYSQPIAIAHQKITSSDYSDIINIGPVPFTNGQHQHPQSHQHAVEVYYFLYSNSLRIAITIQLPQLTILCHCNIYIQVTFMHIIQLVIMP